MVNIVGTGRRVRIYIDETEQWQHKPLYLALLEFLRAEGAAGASVLRGVAGFGANSRIHTATILRLSEDLPVVIDWVDSPERVERLLPHVCDMVAHGLVTVEEAQIVKYTHRPVRADLPDHLRVADVMTTRVLALRAEMRIHEAVRLLVAGGHRAAPVLDADGRVVGIATNGDLVERGGLGARLELLGQAGVDALEQEMAELAAGGRTVKDVMTADVVTIGPDTTVGAAASRMTERRLKRLPVVDAAGRLLGIVSRVDLLRSVAEGYPAPEEPSPVERPAHLVRDIMRTQVPVVGLDASLPEVIDTVVSTRLNRAVVVDGDQRVAGIITDADLVRRLGEHPGVVAALMRRASAVPITNHARAADLMIRDVVTTSPDLPIETAMREMLARQRKILPVVDAERRLLGIVDRFDLLESVARRHRA